jgi:hypothetical protein
VIVSPLVGPIFAGPLELVEIQLSLKTCKVVHIELLG